MREYKEKARGARMSVNFHSKLVAKDRKFKNLEHVKVADKNIFNEGYKWFESGLSLDDAPLELRENFNFINGFDKAKRVMAINEELISLGMEWFESGLYLEDAPDNYKNNEYFISGYNMKNNKVIGK